MNKKIKLVLILMVVVQIFLLMNMPFADSYLIHETEKDKGETKVEKKDNNILNTGISLLVSLLSIKQIGFVSAAEETSWCCLETKAGAICQDVPNGDYDTCKGSPILSSCDKTSTCQRGTCIDEENGLCSVSTKYKCEEDWDSRYIEQIDKCIKGCCTLNGGTTKEYIRQVRCAKEGGSYFDTAVSQDECRLEVTEMGACVFLENCKFTTSEIG